MKEAISVLLASNQYEFEFVDAIDEPWKGHSEIVKFFSDLFIHWEVFNPLKRAIPPW